MKLNISATVVEVKQYSLCQSRNTSVLSFMSNPIAFFMKQIMNKTGIKHETEISQTHAVLILLALWILEPIPCYTPRYATPLTPVTASYCNTDLSKGAFPRSANEQRTLPSLNTFSSSFSLISS